MIYFVQREDGAVKIGLTAHFPTRLRQLEATHGTLRLLGFLPGGSYEEALLHDRFKFCSLGHEWFSPVSELLRFIICTARAKPISHAHVLIDLWQQKEQRDAVRYSQRDIAAGSGLPEGFISKLLNDYDITQIQLGAAVALCDWLGCSLSDFARRVA